MIYLATLGVVFLAVLFSSLVGTIVCAVIAPRARKAARQVRAAQLAYARGVPIERILEMPMPKKVKEALRMAYQKDKWSYEHRPFPEFD